MLSGWGFPFGVSRHHTDEDALLTAPGAGGNLRSESENENPRCKSRHPLLKATTKKKNGSQLAHIVGSVAEVLARKQLGVHRRAEPADEKAVVDEKPVHAAPGPRFRSPHGSPYVCQLLGRGVQVEADPVIFLPGPLVSLEDPGRVVTKKAVEALEPAAGEGNAGVAGRVVSDGVG